jgi:hypothetical protein
VVVIKPKLGVRLLGVLGDIGRLPEPSRERRITDVLAEDLWSRGFGRWAPVLPAIIAATPSRVVTVTDTILLMPFACVEDVARVVVVANAGVDRWGLIPRFLLFRVDRGFLLMCR